MAEVDFSNAVITPVAGTSRHDPPIRFEKLALETTYIMDSSNNQINTNGTVSYAEQTNTIQKTTYTGTFIASGTEFYFSSAIAQCRYKVSNISFNNGDTYSFSIRADLSLNS